MKTFRSLVVLKRPRPDLWTAMRDHLTELAPEIADIDEIRQLERTTDADGVIHLVNEWRVHQQVPAPIRSLLKANELRWLDRNSWDARTFTCTWAIEPQFLTEHIECFGTTAFSDAMGGQGTRVTFEGSFDLKPGILRGLGSLETVLSGFVESVVTTIIPRNLRAVVEAAARR